MAARSSAMPIPGGYWLCPARMAATAASFTSGGPSASGNPWPRLIDAVETANADISAKIVVPNPRRRETRYGASPTSARHEGEPHVTAGVVAVQVDEHDALPGAEQRIAVLHRQDERGRGDRREEMGGTMPTGAVRVPVPVVAWQQPLERI